LSYARHTPGTQPTNLAEGDPVSKMLVGRYEATIYPEGYGFTGAISLGFDGKGTRQRIKRKGRTKAIVKDKLIKVVADREARKAGLGENWTPRELRHSFVSIMSDNGVPIETIADLVGHFSGDPILCGGVASRAC